MVSIRKGYSMRSVQGRSYGSGQFKSVHLTFPAGNAYEPSTTWILAVFLVVFRVLTTKHIWTRWCLYCLKDKCTGLSNWYSSCAKRDRFNVDKVVNSHHRPMHLSEGMYRSRERKGKGREADKKISERSLALKFYG